MTSQKVSFTDAALKAGLIAGSLDATAASIQYYTLTGGNPAKVFQYVASAAFGNQVHTSGTLFGWAAVGLVLHFIIAISFAFFFFKFFRYIKKLLPNWIVAGIVFGLLVWAVMNLIVVPVSFGKPYVFHFEKSATAAAILILAIGLPISWLANRYYSINDSAN